MGQGDVWTANEKQQVVDAFKRGTQRPACPNDDEDVNVSEQGFGAAARVAFHCPSCGARAEWIKSTGVIL